MNTIRNERPVQEGSWLRNILSFGKGLSSLGFSYDITHILSDSAHCSYGYIGFPESGSLLEFLSTIALLYSIVRFDCSTLKVDIPVYCVIHSAEN